MDNYMDSILHQVDNVSKVTTAYIVFSIVWYFMSIRVGILMTLLMNKFTNIVIPIYFEFIHFWYILHPNIFGMNYHHE